MCVCVWGGTLCDLLFCFIMGTTLKEKIYSYRFLLVVSFFEFISFLRQFYLARMNIGVGNLEYWGGGRGKVLNIGGPGGGANPSRHMTS